MPYLNLLLHFNIFLFQRKTLLLNLCFFQKNRIQTFSQCLFWNRMICLPRVKNGGLTTCISISSPFPNHTKVQIEDFERYIHKNKEKNKIQKNWEISTYFWKFESEGVTELDIGINIVYGLSQGNTRSWQILFRNLKAQKIGGTRYGWGK